MNNALLRHLTRWLYRLTASAIIAAALATLLVSLLLPLAQRHPEVISRWLTERAGLPVHVDRLNTGWTKRGPLLQLDGLHIGEGEDAVRIGQAEILIAHYAGLLPGRSFTELRLRGLRLTLERLDDGRWQVRGLPGAAANETDPLSALGKLGELQVISAQLGITAPALGIDTTIPDVDLRVRVEGTRARIAMHARMHPEAAPLRAALDLDRRSGNARAHAAIAQADLAIWSPLLRVDGLMLASGEGQIDAWAELQEFRLSALTSTADLDQLVLQRIAREPDDDSNHDTDQVAFGQVKARLFWRNESGQWRLDAPELRIGNPTQPQVLDGLMLAGGAHLALHAARIDAGPLLAIAALSPRLPPAVREWLNAAKPDAIAHDIALSGSAESGLRGRVRVENLHFASVGQTPGVAGLGGQITLDMHGAALLLTPQTPVQFNWPTGFGVPHHLKLAGTLAAWWPGGADGGVHLMTPALRVDADGYAADLRGGLWFHTDGRRPRIDMAAELDATQIPVAKRFWVRSNMSREAVDWLDMALVSGVLKQGRALVSGELSDWPFDSRDGEHVRGVFDAQGELDAAQVRFQPDWPLLGHFTGPIRFYNDGFSLRGKARIGEIILSEVRASLPHYSQSHLTVSSQASGDMHDWLALLRQSPLHASHGEVLDNLDASGPASASFRMALALGSGHAPVIEGQAELDGVTLTEKRWELTFSDVHGPVAYDHHGFASGELSAEHAGQRSSLSLRAGEGHVRAPGHAFEAALQAQISAADLLARAPQLDWLAPHLAGRSHWNLGLAIAANPDAQGLLSLDSDLVGTTLTLPAPLDKPADVALPTRIHTRLPWGEGEVEVALGERLTLNTHSRSGHTGVSIVLGPAPTPQPAPDNGLVIRGATPALDAAAWATLGIFDTAPTAEPAPAPQLELSIGQLRLPGAEFADVQIRTGLADGHTVLDIDAPALNGRIHWPATPEAPLRAGFTRLHWPALPAYTGPGPDSATPAPAAHTDPRQLPPLDLQIVELRLGELPLGHATLRTQPTAEGLTIDHFLIEGPQQRITARGGWTDTGTRLALDVDSQDLGQLFGGLGLGQQLKGGTGSLRLGGHWPGSPLAFAAARLTGQMNVDLRDGQLLELEPGAGRVLGLLSIAQLPRRLLLDFRDFFGKGFGFNDIAGEIHIASGIARTDGLRINGPAAKIRISGSTDLAARTHAQTIEVSPRTGNLLTAVGAVAGGPLGAAVGAAANAVLKTPLSEIGAKTYRVTGPWQEPEVELMGHTTAMIESSQNQSSDQTPSTEEPPAPDTMPEPALPETSPETSVPKSVCSPQPHRPATDTHNASTTGENAADGCLRLG